MMRSIFEKSVKFRLSMLADASSYFGRFRFCMLCFMFLVSLAACGQKGPLVMPAAESVSEQKKQQPEEQVSEGQGKQEKSEN